ncbi:hypothetical protein CL617_01035 [archaeon]|nr:hypothetical protein [archaeon]|tara:strand:- start:8580 stop:9197 length:618 start_codon:yes stop_codon:yes gene_type:complete
MKRGIRILVLIVTHILLAMPLRFIFKIESIIECNLNNNKKYIIVANHPSKLDPFIILAALPLKEFIKLTPYVFVTSEKYLKKWYYKYLLRIWGCVSNIEKNGKKPLDLLKEKLENGETIFLFPGGELEKEGKSNSPRVGAIYLEREVRDSMLLPISIKVSNKICLKNMLRRNIQTRIHVQKQFRHNEFKKDLQPLADEIYNKIMS